MAIDNPISLLITSDTIIGANVAPKEIVLPVDSTVLAAFDLKITNIIDNKTQQQTITIPAGVNVVAVHSYGLISGSGTPPLKVELYSDTGKIYWESYTVTASDIRTIYIGVTPNKSYTLTFSIQSAGTAESRFGQVRVRYSQSINQQTPSVTDY